MRRRFPGFAVLGLLLCWAPAGYGQSPAPAPAAGDAASQIYAQEPFVLLHRNSVFVYNADGTGSRQTTVAIRVQSEAALKQLGILDISFAGASEHVVFQYARVRRPDGTVTDTPVSSAIEQPAQVTREAPFYSDLKDLQLPIKSLQVGDTLEWQATVTRTKPEAPGQFWGQENFSNDGIVLDETVELRVPAASPLRIWTNPKDIAAPTDTTSGGTRVIQWSHHSLKPTVGAAAAAAAEAEKKRVLTPAEELDATKGALPSIAWTTFPDWAAVGAWYHSLESDRTVPDATVKAKVAELTAGKTTTEDKARAVYNYVSTQIRYIGVAFGVGRYQPHSAAEVLANQYGDCKDKHTLLAAMLTTLGLQPQAVLIGAGIRFNPDVPSPGSFNHLITRVNLDGKDIWLDSTAEVAPWRVLLPAIRDQQALVIPASGAAVVLRTPLDLPYPAYAKMTAAGALDKNGVSESKISMTFRDDDELGLRAVLRQIPASQYGEFVQRLAGGLGYGGTTSEPEIGNLEDLSQPLTISFHYHREKAGDWDNLRTVAQLLPLELPIVDEKNPPTSSIQLGVPRTETSSAEMQLPPGWDAELPEAIHAHAPFARVDTTYRLTGGKLYTERILVVLQAKLPAADWKQYLKWQKEAGVGEDAYVQLTRAKGSEPASAASGKPGDATIPGLLTEASKDFEANRLDAAAKVLDQAKAIDPDAVGVSAELGYLAFRRGKPFDAIQLYSREVDLHPDSVRVYRLLANLQDMTGDYAAAAATMHRWVVAEPDSVPAAVATLRLLVQMKDAPHALAEANAALNRFPNDTGNEELQELIGRALLFGGDTAKGTAILVALLHATTDPIRLNDAAYYLADANEELALDESSERAALDKLAAETQAWTLDEAPQTLKGKSALLVHCWDSMGWILFREGHAEAAEPYLQAAWRNSQAAIIGQHLGDVQLALGDATAAAHTYELALASLPRYDMVGVTVKDDPTADALKAKLAEAVRKGAKPSHADLRAQLQNMRVLPLPGGDARAGDTGQPYSLLISRAGVQRVTSAAPVADFKEKLIQRADFKDFFPPGSTADLVKEVYLNCVGGKCSLVVAP